MKKSESVSCSVISDFFVTLWTIACQVPLSMGFFRQEYWNGLPFPPAGDLPDPGIEPASPASTVLAGGFFTTRATWEAQYCVCVNPKLLIYPSPPTSGLFSLLFPLYIFSCHEFMFPMFSFF